MGEETTHFVPDLDEPERQAQLIRGMADQVRSGSFEIPELPRTLIEIQRFANSPQMDLPRLVRIVERDGPLATKLLRAASAAAFGGTRVTQLGTAIIRLGVNGTRDLAFAASMGRIFRCPALEGRMREEHQHAFAVAAGVAALSRGPRVDSGEIFLCGLLHDIGRPALLGVVADHGRRDPAYLQPDFLDAILTSVHAQAGSLLLARWNLSPLAKIVAATHHHPEAAPPHAADVVRAVALADAADEMEGEVEERVEALAVLPLAHGVHRDRLRALAVAIDQSRNDPDLRSLLG